VPTKNIVSVMSGTLCDPLYAFPCGSNVNDERFAMSVRKLFVRDENIYEALTRQIYSGDAKNL
jgi:hypothetical protein